MRPNLVIRALACLLLVGGLVASEGASAQRFERNLGRGPATAERTYDGFMRNRGYEIYSTPRGHSGTITSSTPNRDGNFGGPGNGGSGGGGN